MSFFSKIFYFFCAPCKPNRSLTVRYAFPLIFTFAALLGAATVVSTNKSFIHIESSVSSVRAGQIFSIDVFVTAHVPVNAVNISLDFPKDQVQITGIDTGESVITLWTQQPYIENNTVVLSGGTFRRGFIGTHRIAKVNARAIESGLAQFNISDVTLLAGDGTGTSVKVSKTDADSATLYVLGKDEASPAASEEGVGLEGTISVFIITDIDGDGKVTLADISRFMAAWSSKSTIFDFNNDGKMTFIDFGIILADSFFR